MNYCTLAPHALHPHKPDTIYAMNQAAGEAAKKYGADQVINGTLGSCIDDDGKPMILDAVDRLMRALPVTEFYNYAPITGVPGFEAAVSKSLFGTWKHPFTLAAVPTPGGTGALRNLVWNFLEDGEPVLSTDLCWNPYRNICVEHNRAFVTFPMFDSEGNFNLDGFAASASKLVAENARTVILINTPGHNPTGYRMSEREMQRVADIVSDLAKDKTKQITVCLDFSYIDYDRVEGEAQAMVSCFDALPENTMLTGVFSMSKSYTSSGIRLGALVAFARTEEAAEEFRNTMAFSARSVWSNAVRCAQRVMVDICNDDALYAEMDAQRRRFAAIIKNRGLKFREAAESLGLPIHKYSSGFFICVPCPDSQKFAQALMEKNLFVVPIPQGIRFSVCSTHTEKCIRAAKTMAETYHELFG